MTVDPKKKIENVLTSTSDYYLIFPIWFLMNSILKYLGEHRSTAAAFGGLTAIIYMLCTSLFASVESSAIVEQTHLRGTKIMDASKHIKIDFSYRKFIQVIN